MPELLCHLLGDYCLQNQWMADNKTKRWWPAFVHVCVYTLVFVLWFKPSLLACSVMFGTHLLIDRFRLAKYWVNFYKIGTGESVPAFLSVWLLIIVDNTFHLCINHWALNYL